MGTCLVHDTREAHLEADLIQRRDKPQPAGRVVRGVGPVHKQHGYTPIAHRLGEVRETLVAGSGGRRIRSELHRVAHVARDVVQDVDRGSGCVRLIVLGTNAPGDRQAWHGGKLGGEAANRFRRNTTHTSDHIGIVPLQQGPDSEHVKRRIVRGVGEDDVGDPQCQHALGAWVRGHPFVRAERRHAHAGLDVHVASHLIVDNAVSRTEITRELDGAQPGLEKVRPERQHISRGGELVFGDHVQPEHGAVRFTQCLVREWLVHESRLRADGSQPLIDQPVKRAASMAGQESHLIARGCAHPLDDSRVRVFPRNRLELTCSVAGHRPPHSIRVVQSLK